MKEEEEEEGMERHVVLLFGKIIVLGFFFPENPGRL